MGRAEFDERTFLSDYRFLEEVKLADDVAKRSKPPAPKLELPQFLQTLQYQARRWGGTLKPPELPMPLLPSTPSHCSRGTPQLAPDEGMGAAAALKTSGPSGSTELHAEPAGRHLHQE